MFGVSLNQGEKCPLTQYTHILNVKLSDKRVCPIYIPTNVQCTSYTHAHYVYI
jgi:hypothetical protein